MHNDARLAKTSDEFKSLTASSENWFIRSAEDADRHLDSENGPLAGIPASAVQEFKKTLTFKNGGLAHADYTSIYDHISLKQFHALWASFGISPVLFSDYDNKRCAGTHICDNQYLSVCSANC